MSNDYELPLWQGNHVVLGLDEAGRGPLAGPLVVCGVILPKYYEHAVIFDSKKLSEKKRHACFLDILSDALWIGIEIVDEKTIDAQNIYRATQLAMERIVTRSGVSHALSDAMPLPSVVASVTSIIKGDQKSISIAAASIVAKVVRDTKMIALDQQYPEYGFAQHKGYGTKAHLEALKKYGALPIHRRSFQPVSSLKWAQLDL